MRVVADAQRLGDARLHLQLAVGPAHLAGALPAPQQQLHRLLVQLGAVLRQLAPTGVQRRHQGQQQRPRGQVAQVGPLLQGRAQLRAFAGRGVRVPAQGRPHGLVPPLDEAADLLLVERRQGQRRKARQAPLRIGVGIGPRGHQDARLALGQGVGQLGHRLEQHLPALPRLRHLVQAVQQDEAALGQQPALEVGEERVGRGLARDAPRCRRPTRPTASRPCPASRWPAGGGRPPRAAPGAPAAAAEWLRQPVRIGRQQISQVVHKGGLARAGVAQEHGAGRGTLAPAHPARACALCPRRAPIAAPTHGRSRPRSWAGATTSRST